MVPAIGPKGHDTIWQPTQFYRERGKAYMEGFVAKHPNASIVTSPFETPDFSSLAGFDPGMAPEARQMISGDTSRFEATSLDPIAGTRSTTAFSSWSLGEYCGDGTINEVVNGLTHARYAFIGSTSRGLQSISSGVALSSGMMASTDSAPCQSRCAPIRSR